VIKNPGINKNLVANKGDAQADFIYNNFFPNKSEAMLDITSQVDCKWSHKENDFLDYNVSIPYSAWTFYKGS
jgi:hypothetical protein